MKFIKQAFTLGFFGIILLTSCSKNDWGKDLEIENKTNSFAFQVTDIAGVTETLEYKWENEGKKADVNQACSITNGTATLTIFDANGTQVYSRNLKDNGTYFTSEGIAGTWKIKLELSDVDGTLNFRVQKGG